MQRLIANENRTHIALVDIIESERGWGRKVDETLVFYGDTNLREEVKNYIKKFNARNDKNVAPDIYWFAKLAHFSEIGNGYSVE
jgi:hypothetical protein